MTDPVAHRKSSCVSGTGRGVTVCPALHTDDVCSCRAFVQKTFVMKMFLQALQLLWATSREVARAQSAPVGKPMSPLAILCGLLLLALVVLTWVPLGNSELYRAMWDGDEARALALITAGAKPNSRFGATHQIDTANRAVLLNPLHFALARALPTVAVALIEAGADPNSRDDEGKTALIVAANKGFTEVVRALLAKGAD